MSKITLFLLLLIGFQTSYSQIENNKKNEGGIYIGAKTKIPAKPTSPSNFDNSDGFKTAYNKEKKKKEKENNEKKLKEKGILSQAKLNEERWDKNIKSFNQKLKRVDQDLGSFQTNAKYVRIICRDFQYPDGDRVTIYINDIPAVYNIELTQNYQEFKIPLVRGLNKIAFKALNQGTSGPNTAGFKVYDDGNVLISANEWNLATGAVATLVIAKDK